MVTSDGDCVTMDAFLGGQITIEQPRDGYRAAMDPVLLAAAVPEARRVLELGCGVGTALLCYGQRVKGAKLYGLELDAQAAERAKRNAALNEMSGRATILAGDVLALPADFANGEFDQVLANPPFDRQAESLASPQSDRARSNREGKAALKDWIAAMLKAVRPKGGLTIIHRADRVDEILHRFYGKAGDAVVIPLWPRRGIAAKRVIIRARKGARGGAILHPGLVLHGPEGQQRYTQEASAILRDGAALP